MNESLTTQRRYPNCELPCPTHVMILCLSITIFTISALYYTMVHLLRYPQNIGTTYQYMYFYKYYVLLQILCTSTNIIYFYKYYVLLQILCTSTNIMYIYKYYVLLQILCTSTNIIYFYKYYVLLQILCKSTNIIDNICVF